MPNGVSDVNTHGLSAKILFHLKRKIEIHWIMAVENIRFCCICLSITLYGPFYGCLNEKCSIADNYDNCIMTYKFRGRKNPYLVHYNSIVLKCSSFYADPNKQTTNAQTVKKKWTNKHTQKKIENEASVKFTCFRTVDNDDRTTFVTAVST